MSAASPPDKRKPERRVEAEPLGGGPGSASERSLNLLAVMARAGKAMPLAELAALLSLPKATTHRLCAQLVERGFLTRGLQDSSYSVGPALRTLAFNTLNNDVERGARHAILDGLVRKVSETCNFTTLDGAQVLYLDRVEAHWPLRLSLDVGSHVPLHCTASGKLFLAMMAPPQRQQILAALPLTAHTDSTITRVRELNAECESIAKRGYSTDREEFVAGLIAVAVPVRNEAGETRAAIAIHAPTARMSLNQAIAKLPVLKAAAQAMAGLL